MDKWDHMGYNMPQHPFALYTSSPVSGELMRRKVGALLTSASLSVCGAPCAQKSPSSCWGDLSEKSEIRGSPKPMAQNKHVRHTHTHTHTQCASECERELIIHHFVEKHFRRLSGLEELFTVKHSVFKVKMAAHVPGGNTEHWNTCEFYLTDLHISIMKDLTLIRNEEHLLNKTYNLIKQSKKARSLLFTISQKYCSIMSGPQGWPVKGNDERSRFIPLNRWLAWYCLDQGLGFGPPWHVDGIRFQPTWLCASTNTGWVN